MAEPSLDAGFDSRPRDSMKPTVHIVQGDAERLPFADESVDLVFGSPPYCDARTYGIDAQRDCAEWVEWMLRVSSEALRVSRGAVIWVAASVTRDRTYWPAVEGLMYEWWKRGGSAYRPCYFHRVGVPGSGGDQWYRADVEYVVCLKRPGKLPYSDVTANGHPPKWAPGGAMSNRLADGTRCNKWGSRSGCAARNADGSRQNKFRPSHRPHTKRNSAGTLEIQNYAQPVLANPGNVVQVNVGGGLMGSRLAHQNEAPFPEALAAWFIRSHCPPGGIVLDPFGGSGTTAAAAIAHGRSAISLDLRASQCELARRRLAAGVQTELQLPVDAIFEQQPDAT